MNLRPGVSGFLRGLGAALIVFAAFAAGAGLRPTTLRCESLDNPLGIDTRQPRLSWMLESGERGQRQTAYQIRVAGSPADLDGPRQGLWDTGKVESDSSLHVGYAGPPLTTGQRCFWKVRVWDQEGNASAWSDRASWEMGRLSPGDWEARWIGRTTDTNSNPAPLFRRAFEVPGKVRQARLYVSGLGYYELRLNGRKVGDHLLDPGYTRYDRRVLYCTYDVTAMVRRGRNALGAMLGNGWYNVHTKAVWDFHQAPWRDAPKLLLQLRLDYADGRSEVISTDSSWLTSTGPIIFDSIYGGETYDARLEKPGWDMPDYDDSGWSRARVMAPPAGRLVAQMMPPIKADQVLKPARITEPKPGTWILDFGQNMAGFVELKARGPAGAKVVMKYGERLNKQGMLDRADIQKHVVKLDPAQQYQTDTYIFKGKGEETWHSRFTYHGFQYVEVTGFPGKPIPESFRAVFIHSAVRPVGEFECSNPLFNRIWRAARWSYLSNLQGIPTDCPHREKNGWTGDAHLAAEQGLFNYDSAAVYTKWINDLGDEQRPTGELPGIVPTSGWGYEWGNGPAWDSAFVLIPQYLYEYCGDTRVLCDHYEGIKRYVDYLTGKANRGIVNLGLNDWAPWKTQTPTDITSTAYYYRDAQVVALAARLLGKNDEARHYAELAASIRKAFNAAFYRPETGLYGNGSQTSLSCALYQGLVEPEHRERVLTNLLNAVAMTGGHIDTGILGAKYILNALTDCERADVAYRIASQRDQPSWGWWLEQGATTLWEQWNGTESRNHIMFGDISAWFFKALAGINPHPNAPGFGHILIRPNVVGDLTFARATYGSVRGRIASGWQLRNGRFELDVVIPANSTGTVFMPSAVPATVREGGKPASEAAGVRFLRVENGRSLFEIGSGHYRFSCPR